MGLTCCVMTKVGTGLGDKTGSNCSKAVPIFDKQTDPTLE